jgi:hypothetical protein
VVNLKLAEEYKFITFLLNNIYLFNFVK